MKYLAYSSSSHHVSVRADTARGRALAQRSKQTLILVTKKIITRSNQQNIEQPVIFILKTSLPGEYGKNQVSSGQAQREDLGFSFTLKPTGMEAGCKYECSPSVPSAAQGAQLQYVCHAAFTVLILNLENHRVRLLPPCPKHHWAEIDLLVLLHLRTTLGASCLVPVCISSWESSYFGCLLDSIMCLINLLCLHVIILSAMNSFHCYCFCEYQEDAALQGHLFPFPTHQKEKDISFLSSLSRNNLGYWQQRLHISSVRGLDYFSFIPCQIH